MLKVIRWFMEFMQEIHRGQAMMRGEIEPGTYQRRQRRDRWCKSSELRAARNRNRRHRARRQRRRPV